MESIIGLYKTECIATDAFHHRPYKTPADVEYATAGWVDWWNNRRLHGTLDMTTPEEYETAHHTALNPEEQPVRGRQETPDASLHSRQGDVPGWATGQRLWLQRDRLRSPHRHLGQATSRPAGNKPTTTLPQAP